ncbi:MAG: cirA 6 [Firmicutes bacterium]|nr:cirA 6 [Bacillota bacterium]
MKNRLLRKRIMVALVAGTFLWGSQALAAEDATQDTTFQLDQVTITADRITQTVGETPANVTVITEVELKNKGARTLADALTGVSGIVLKTYGGTGQNAYPYIFGTERVVVLMDGKRMNLPQGVSSGAGGIDVNTILLGDNVDHIEVVRGGASTLYGADAVGGVINIITKKGSSAEKTTATVASGNYGARYYELSTGGQEKNTHWQLSGVKNSGDGQRQNSAYEGKNLSLRLDQDLSASESLNFTYDYYDNHAGMPGSLTYPSTTDFSDILRRNWSIGYTKQHTDGNRTFRYYDNDQVYSGDNSGVFWHHNTVRAFEYQDSARVNDANLLTWGTEWRQDEVESTSESSTLRDRITRAAYLENQYSFNKAAKMTVGLRRDDNSVYGTHWLPQAGYLYQINAKTSYFANWAKVFKAPTFDDLYYYDGYGYMVGNPDLKPESGWTAETGIKTRLSKISELTVSVFKRDISDAIDWVNTSGSIWQPININHYKATGLNANIISKVSPNLTTDCGYTYLDSCDQDGADVGDPRHSIHIGVNLQAGKLNQAVYGLYQDKTGLTTSRVSSHFLINFSTKYTLNSATSLFLTVNNLLDKEYQGVYNYPASRRTVLFGVKQTL